jgi:hypothetical protein
MADVLEMPVPLTSAGTNVTGTLVDSSGTTWATAVVLATLKFAANTQGPYTFNGAAFQMRFRVVADATGAFTIAGMPDNYSITPRGSMWHFTIAPNADSAVSVQFDLFIAGPSMDISPTFTAQTAAQNINLVQSLAVPRSDSAANVIVTPNDGQMYFDTTLQQMFYWSDGVWTPFNVAEQGGDAYKAYIALPQMWGPNPDWWNIQKMVETGRLQWGQIVSIQDLRYGMIVPDTTFTSVIPGDGSNYYLSDNTQYLNNTTAVTHTWNLSKDKPSSDGFADRAIIVGNASQNISLTALPQEVLYIYVGPGTLMGINVANYSFLRALICGPQTIGDPNAFGSSSSFNTCRGLIRCDIPDGVTSIATNVFGSCCCVISINLPVSLSYIASQAFAPYLFGLYIVRSLCPTITWAPDAFGQAFRELSVPVGWQPSGGVSFASYTMSPGGITKMIQNAAGTSPFTLTIGAANISMLPQSTLNLAASKGITLA